MIRIFISKSSKVTERNLRAISDFSCLIIITVAMGTCGYNENRPPISKVRSFPLSSISSMLIFTHKLSWLTQHAIVLDRFNLCEPERKESIDC